MSSLLPINEHWTFNHPSIQPKINPSSIYQFIHPSIPPDNHSQKKWRKCKKILIKIGNQGRFGCAPTHRLPTHRLPTADSPTADCTETSPAASRYSISDPSLHIHKIHGMNDKFVHLETNAMFLKINNESKWHPINTWSVPNQIQHHITHIESRQWKRIPKTFGQERWNRKDINGCQKKLGW